VPADVVSDDRQHRVAAIGPQHVAGLAAFDVDEAQLRATRESHAGAAAGGHDVSLGHATHVTSAS
jgi:hypothetical protein